MRAWTDDAESAAHQISHVMFNLFFSSETSISNVEYE
jgi:hypothetical protein